MQYRQADSARAIAIIGMAGLFPQARTLREFWRNIVEKRDCITDIPSTHWNIDDYYDPDPATPDKTYCKRGGFLPEVDFDPIEFGLPPSILEVTDSSQLLGLVVAQQVLEDAGYGQDRQFDREKVAIVLGVTGPQKLSIPLISRLQYPVWQKVLQNNGVPEAATIQIVEQMKRAYIAWEENAMPGFLGNVIAGRIANRLNLGGMNCVVDAACASSLAAIKVAISELLEARCDMVITGGVDTDTSIFQYVSFSKTPAFSQHTHPKPFDRDADGMVPGEGIGMVLLKRLEDAERDGNRIYAVIRGVGASSDGKNTSIYAPLSQGQARALRRAYDDAHVPAPSVDLIEAHGTGTPAGDLAEFTALSRIFSQDNGSLHHIALGSIKSQIGHTKAAAGVAGLIKVALALHQKILPATLNLTQPNPKLPIEQSPLYLNTETRPWIKADGEAPRRAGVSSFGFGGTNYHVVLEEYQAEHAYPYRMLTRHQLILVHSPSAEALLRRCYELVFLLSSADASEHYWQLIEASRSTQVAHDHPRIAFIATSAQEAQGLLQAAITLLEQQRNAQVWQHPKGIYFRAAGIDPRAKKVALFSGQGSQYVNMGKELALNFPEIRQFVGRFDKLFRAAELLPMSSAMFPIPTFNTDQAAAQAKTLQDTRYAQAAIGALSASLYSVLRRLGFAPDIVAGHSFGELTALWAAQVIGDDEFITLTMARGQAMASEQRPGVDMGMMVAVTGNIEQLQHHQLIRSHDVAIVNWNAPNQVVLAGSKSSLQFIQKALHEDGYTLTPLPVSAAFHTSLISYAQETFAQALERVQFYSPAVPVYSNVTADMYSSDPAAIQALFSQHMLQPVRFMQEIEQIYQSGGSVFIEFGPRDVLTRLVDAILGDRPHLSIALNQGRNGDSDKQFWQAIAQLIVAGVALQSHDPYDLLESQTKARKRSAGTIRLNGSNYLTQATKAAADRALQEASVALTMDTPQKEPLVNSSRTHPQSGSAAYKSAQVEHNGTSHSTTTPRQSLAPQHTAWALAEIGRYQQETLHIHEKLLAHQIEFTKLVGQLIQQQQSLLLNQQSNVDSNLLNMLTHTMTLLSDQQRAFQHTHDRYLDSRSEYTRLFFDVIQHQNYPEHPSYERLETSNSTRQEDYADAGDPPIPASLDAGLPDQTMFSTSNILVDTPDAPREAVPGDPAIESVKYIDVLNMLMQIISDKTHYPLEILEPAMELEADLGVDSIKRVQILNALLDRFPQLPEPDLEEVAQLRTISAIANFITATGERHNRDTFHSGGRLALNANNIGHQNVQDTNDIMPGLVRKAVHTRFLPSPDNLDCGLTQGRICLITHDGTSLASELSKALISKGWKTVLLGFPNVFVNVATDIPQEAHYYVLPDLEDTSLEHLLESIQERHGACGAFIHLHPVIKAEKYPLFLEYDKVLVKYIFLIAKYLSKTLRSAAIDGRSWFCTVTRLDGQCGFGHTNNFSVVGGGITGLTKSLNLEWERVFCRSIDIGCTEAIDQDVSHIIAELHDTNRLITEVGYYMNQRLTISSE